MIQRNGPKYCANTSLGTELYRADKEPEQLDQLTLSGHYFAFIYLNILFSKYTALRKRKNSK